MSELVRITHPDVDEAAEVPEASLAMWTEAGWTKATTTDDDDSPAPRKAPAKKTAASRRKK